MEAHALRMNVEDLCGHGSAGSLADCAEWGHSLCLDSHVFVRAASHLMSPLNCVRARTTACMCEDILEESVLFSHIGPGIELRLSGLTIGTVGSSQSVV